MTVAPSIDPARFLEEHLAQASPDLLRDMLTTFINTLLSADADAVCGADYRSVSEERTNRRNGYRHRDFDTRAGTLDVAISEAAAGHLLPRLALGAPSPRRTCPDDGGDDLLPPLTFSGSRRGGWRNSLTPSGSRRCRSRRCR